MQTRLFRALVVFGASLTGGVGINACTGGGTTGGVDTAAANDASADGEYGRIVGYGRISAGCANPPTCYPSVYPNISPPPLPRDAGGEDAADASDGSDSG